MLLSFNPSNFISNLHYMGKGMLAIGVVMLILIAVTALLNKLSNKKK
ncbi:MAG: hypothetical protein IJN15_01665 [Clostridia bacterium]|nr:hypothetical protein [Clostridia bacterium]